jgi:hypothetical protein
MDELDRLLSNVDDDYDRQSMKENEQLASEKTARKSDKNIGEETFDEESGESFDSIHQSLALSDELKPYSVNFLEGLKAHWNYVVDFKNLISDLTLPDPVLEGLRKHKYQFLRFVESIEKLYDDFVSTKSLDDLEKKAKQEFHKYFPANESTNQKINFVILAILFLRLREFNSQVRREWEGLKSSLSIMNMVNESSSFTGRADDIISGGLKTALITDKFLALISAVMYIPKKDFDVFEKDIVNRVYFREDFDYDYKALFKVDEPNVKPKSSLIQDILEKKEKPVENNQAPSNQSGTPLPKVQEKTKEVVVSNNFLEETGQYLKVPGKSSWNTNEPYKINLNPVKFEANLKDIMEAVVFIDTKKSKEGIDAIVKRALIKNLRSSIPFEPIRDNYDAFIFKSVAKIVDALKEFITESDFDPDLFVYHCGPFTVYSILYKIFERDQIGICFKRLTDSKIVRFIPEEYVKLMVMAWFTHNLYPLSTIDFDKINEFNRLRTYIQHRYAESVSRNLEKINIAVAHHYKQTGVHKSPQAVLAVKAEELYPLLHKEVYKRFVERTLFKK